MPVSDSEPGGGEEHDTHRDQHVPTTLAEALTQRAVLLGRVMQLETQNIEREADRDRPMSEREQEHVEGELRSSWSRYAAGEALKNPATWRALHDLGLGDV